MPSQPERQATPHQCLPNTPEKSPSGNLRRRPRISGSVSHRIEVLDIADKIAGLVPAHMKATYAPICILDVAGEAPVPVPAHVREAIAPILRLGLVRQGLWK